MAALPKFSFSGWTSQSLAPKVAPAPVGPQARTVKLDASGRPVLPPGHSYAKVQPKGLPAGVYNVTRPDGGGYNTMPIRPGVDIVLDAKGIQIAGPVTGVGGAVNEGWISESGVPGAPPSGKTLVGTTGAGNTDLPAWLQSEVDRINAQDALRKAALGGSGGAVAPNQNIGDILQGVAAITAARTGYNAQINQLNEQARLQALINQRNQLRPVGAFGFNNPLDVNQQIGLDREIEAYRNVNLPAASRAVSGWVGGPKFSNGLLNGTGYA